MFWGVKTKTIFASIVIISPLQNVIQDQAANATSTGMSACEIKAGLLKRTIARKVLHRLHTGQLKQRWTKRFSNIINVPIPSLIKTMISVSFVDENFWTRLR